MSNINDNFSAKLNYGLTTLNLKLDSNKIEKLLVLIKELERWNKKINLTAIRSIEDMVSGHLLDSLIVGPHLKGKSIIDVGTGAGFPGLPLAIIDPSLEFLLLDSNGKKIGFIKHIINMLELKNTSAIKNRAEDYVPSNGFDTVIARAITDLPRLIRLTQHMLHETGSIIALKGKKPITEIQKIPAAWKASVCRVSVPGLETHERHIISLTKPVK